MKKILACLLAAVLLMGLCCPALAATKPVEISYTGPATLTAGQSAVLLKTVIHSTQAGEILFTLTDKVSNTVVYTENRAVAAGQTLSWSVPYYDGGMTASKPIKRLQAGFAMDGKVYTYDLYYHLDSEGTVTIEKATWYPNNTACSFGPKFRDIRPGMTDKWYMFTPIDLTKQGRQTFEYDASNMYIIGEVYVDVAGDSVTVTYHNFYEEAGGNTETLSEFLTFFPDLASVKNVEPETMGDLGFAFGQPISIQNDLNGDTNVLMFIRNRVTYADYVNSTHKLTRFWPNHPDHKALCEQMMAIMD